MSDKRKTVSLTYTNFHELRTDKIFIKMLKKYRLNIDIIKINK